MKHDGRCKTKEQFDAINGESWKKDVQGHNIWGIGKEKLVTYIEHKFIIAKSEQTFLFHVDVENSLAYQHTS